MKPQISKEVRAKLKRLCPYIGPNVPESVRQSARGFWGDRYDPENTGQWLWDDGSGAYQCEVELCDMDAKTCDPAGYVAIRPLEQDKYALIFMLGIPELSGPPAPWLLPETFLSDPPSYRKNLIFDSIQEAKRYLDTLIAYPTPDIPRDWPNDLCLPG